MNTKRLLFAGLGLVLAVAVMSTHFLGCRAGSGDDTAISSGGEMPSDAAQESNTGDADAASQLPQDRLTLSLIAPQSLNPLKTEDAETAQLLMLIFQPMLDIDSEGHATERGLAESYSISADGCTVTLKLRSRSTFSNGARVTADDAEFSLAMLLPQNTTTYWGELLRDISAISSSFNTVTITFSVPVTPARLGILAIPVLPRDLFSVGVRDAEIIGSGPYVISEYQRMKNLVLKARDAQTPIQTIDVLIARTPEAERSAFSRGMTQVLYETAVTGLSVSNVNHDYISYLPDGRLRYLAFNTQEGHAFAAAEVRKALYAALDTEDLLTKTAMRTATVAQSFIPQSVGEHTDELSTAADLIQARVLIQTTERLPIRLIVSEEDAYGASQGRMVRDALLQLGYDVSLDVLTADDYAEAMTEGEYDLYFDETDLKSYSQVAEFYRTFSVDTEDAWYASDAAAYTRALNALTEALSESMPICPLYYLQSTVLISNQLKDNVSATPQQAYRGLETLTFAE